MYKVAQMIWVPFPQAGSADPVSYFVSSNESKSVGDDGPLKRQRLK